MQIQWSDVYDYNERTVNNNVYSKAGVYRLSVKLKDNSFRIFYVGRSDDLKKRLLEHLSDSERNKCLLNHIKDYTIKFRFAYIPLEQDRKDVEYTLYKKVKPECNEIEPEGKIIDVNLELGN